MLSIKKKLGVIFALFTLLISSVVNAKTTVYAAASLTNALQDIAVAYEKEYPNNELVFSFASSSTLAKQIEQGAPADIFISANNKWLQHLSAQGFTQKSSEKLLLGNDLVLIAPISSTLTEVNIPQGEWLPLLDQQFLSVGDPDHVPAGQYLKESLVYLNLWDQVANKLARGKDVRAALALVERAEVPLGVVYGTDAKVSDKVKIVGVFPQESYTAVEYPMAILKGRDNPEVEAFYHYLQSPTAKNIFTHYGFSIK
ncbi:molybdate transport system substrate-binding protein [Volucribacter psittacicida]|uniref:Molybdate transport system substrate-binding protein n=1 Tax=Volucribacter psittacicida TaxID=203482 RepID=A0A4R1G2R5_9PAST|nr:molybdate ABC transporter substrate-binding protein [Volucribacter psittacicida]TCK01908.1 molybdate transport system substrate-binding protein [Volucribacter psittacicida]